MKNIEGQLVQLENRKSKIEEDFRHNAVESTKIDELSIELSKIQTQIDQKEMRWLELSEWL